MSVDFKFVFLLSKQTHNFISTPKRAYFPTFIDEIIIPNEMGIFTYYKKRKNA